MRGGGDPSAGLRIHADANLFKMADESIRVTCQPMGERMYPLAPEGLNR